MGVNSSKNLEYNIPDQKIFKLSYIIYKNIEIKSEIKSIDLSQFIFNETDNIITSFLKLKLKNEGYSLTNLKIEYNTIETIFNNFNQTFDFKIISDCYKPNLNNIYHFLNNGNILLAGIILEPIFLKDILKIEQENTVSDYILIVGYDFENFFIKTNWCNHILKIDNKFIKNIKEIWDVKIKTFY